MADCTVLTVVPNLLLLGTPENQQPFGPSFFFLPLSVVLYVYFMGESGFFICLFSSVYPLNLSQKIEVLRLFVGTNMLI